MILFFLIVTVVYAALILIFSFYWEKEKPQNYIPSKMPKVSVIVACRNEEKNIGKLVECLQNQTYKNCEFIFINDHSEDSTKSIILRYNDPKIKILDLLQNEEGKKAALIYGQNQADGEILYFTDADCILSSKCIEIYVAEMLNNDYQMACGPVCFNDNKSFFSRMEQLEFLSLTGSSASGFFMDMPFMCNGANFAIYRNVYKESLSKIKNEYSSGDDMFLLHYVQKNYNIGFVQQRNCIVETEAPKTLKAFFDQRIRWASKTGGYENKFSKYIALIVFFISLAMLTSFFGGVFNSIYFLIFGCIFICKLVIDAIFIIPVLQFYQKENLLIYIVPLTFVYPFYVFYTVVACLFYKPKWKGRKIKINEKK